MGKAEGIIRYRANLLVLGSAAEGVDVAGTVQ
jgi:hypothetical protein